jgi:hypothetical protein
MRKGAVEVATTENDAPVVKIAQYIAAQLFSYTSYFKSLMIFYIFVTLASQA